MKQSIRLYLTFLLLVVLTFPSFCWYDNEYFSVYATPKNIYLIGDYNDWKLPVKEDLNGALQVHEVNRTVAEYDGHNYNHYTYTYTISHDMFPKGDSRFVMYVADGNLKGFYHDESLTPVFGNNRQVFPIYIQQDPYLVRNENHYGVRETTRNDSLNIEKAFVLKDWNGGIITIKIDNNYAEVGIKELQVSSPNASYVTAPEHLYANCQIDDAPAELKRCDELFSKYGRRTSSFELTALTGTTFKFLFHIEDTPDIESEMIFGTLYPDPIIVEDDMDFRIPIIEGGFPIDIRLKCEGNLNLTIHPVTKNIEVSITDMNVSVDTIVREENTLRYEDDQIILDYKAYVRIYDVTGKLILTDYASKIDISSFVSGVYIVKSENNTLKIQK